VIAIESCGIGRYSPWEWLVMKRCLLILFLLAGWANSVCAQTTQPASPEWDQAVQMFAKASAAAGEDCKPLLANDCCIRSFDSGSNRQIADLMAHTSGNTLLMARAYVFPAGTVAADIGAAVNDSQVSDDVKRLLVPAEGDATAKAN